MTRACPFFESCTRLSRIPGAPVARLCVLGLACALLATGPARAQKGLAGRPSFSDLNGDKVFDRLGARMERAQLDDSFDVVVTFRVPLEQVNFPLVQAQVGAFGPARGLRLTRAVATRLTRRQIAAMASAGIVE